MAKKTDVLDPEAQAGEQVEGGEAKDTKPAAPAKKVQGWDRKLRHFGVYTNFRKQDFPAYLEFQEADDQTRGFALFCVATHKEFKPGVRVLNAEHLKLAKIEFKLNGKSEPAEKAKSKPISKAKRNAQMAAAAPKVDEDAD